MIKVTHAELNQVLTTHKLWLETDGLEGDRANLFRANLTYTNLRGANLNGANLRSVNPPLSIRDCRSFDGAKFSAEVLPWLILHPKWALFKDTVQIAD